MLTQGEPSSDLERATIVMRSPVFNSPTTREACAVELFSFNFSGTTYAASLSSAVFEQETASSKTAIHKTAPSRGWPQVRIRVIVFLKYDGDWSKGVSPSGGSVRARR